MKNNKTLAATILMILIPTIGFADYSGKGGMTEREIKPEVYLYHYEHGFTGVDAMGWDPNLQYAWSRAGAALTCNVKMNKEFILKKMSEKFGYDTFIHDMNGIGFHHMESQKIENFCTKERVAEIREVIPRLEAGDFPKLF